jgi:uncharacterized membrane protein
MALATAGGLVLAQSITNVEIKKLLGIQSGGIRLQKAITIMAPLHYVYRTWMNFENFPRFMSHVREVTDLGNGRSRWVVDGPGRVPVEWTARITQLVPERVLAWKSEEGAFIRHEGVIRFEPERNSGTRVHLRFSYSPPAGVAGHAAAVLVGSDPKRRMEEDLVRMKSFIETGTLPRGAAAKSEPPDPEG